MLGPRDQRRRWFGTLYLIIAAGMLFWGETLLKPYLVGQAFVIYWLVCLGATLMAIWAAWLDLRAIRRISRHRQQQLRERTLRGLEAVGLNQGARRTPAGYPASTSSELPLASSETEFPP